jgi:hypothetical protein
VQSPVAVAAVRVVVSATGGGCASAEGCHKC